MADKEERLSKRNAKKCAEVTKILVRQEMRAHNKKVGHYITFLPTLEHCSPSKIRILKLR